jgi:hypothetical protein
MSYQNVIEQYIWKRYIPEKEIWRRRVAVIS